MMISDRDCDEEDEDVVIAGSELHEALSKMGYSDYEVIAVSNQEPSASVDSSKSVRKQKSDGWISQILYKRISSVYRYMTKDNKFSKKQLTTISEAQHLLDDHADLIKSLLKDDSETEESGMNYFLSYLQYAAVATVGYYFIKRSNPFTWFVTLPALTTVRYKYTNWRTNRDLKRLISEQTELHYAYKRVLRILNHSFRMNTSSAKQSGSKFTDIGAEKLKFLQPITERTVKSIGTLSTAYYETTLIIGELLPGPYRQNFDSQITYFDKECFTNCGEVTYNGLKQLFYRFILIQSEMLLSLAVLRHSDPNDFCDGIKRGMKIDHRVKQLLRLTNEHRISMMKIVDNFQKQKLTTVENKYRGGFPGSKWQDLYLRLHLTSHKMQRAYDNVTSVLDDIENHIDRRTDETELVEQLKMKLDDVCNDALKARDLALLSSLIISKMSQNRLNGENQNPEDDDNAVEISRRDIPVVKDTDPEIIDEVFEEYIRERYSEALLNQDGDDYFEKTYKLDKMLSKNLMHELKEALIDKQKDTKERESRALKRMNKNPEDGTATKDDGDLPLESLVAGIESSASKKHLELESTNDSLRDETGNEKIQLNCIPMPPPPPMPKEFGQLEKELGEVKGKEDRGHECFVPLPSSRNIPMPLFLANNEETFIGSGENSEEEIVSESEEECGEDGEEGTCQGEGEEINPNS